MAPNRAGQTLKLALSICCSGGSLDVWSYTGGCSQPQIRLTVSQAGPLAPLLFKGGAVMLSSRQLVMLAVTAIAAVTAFMPKALAAPGGRLCLINGPIGR